MRTTIKYPFPLNKSDIVTLELPCRVLTQEEVKRLSTLLAALGGIAKAYVQIVYRDEAGRFIARPREAKTPTDVGVKEPDQMI